MLCFLGGEAVGGGFARLRESILQEVLQDAQVLRSTSPAPLHGHGCSWRRGCWPHTRHGVRKVTKALLLKGMLVPNSNGNDGNKALNPVPAQSLILGRSFQSASWQRPTGEFVMWHLSPGGDWHVEGICLPLQKSNDSAMTQPPPWD